MALSGLMTSFVMTYGSGVNRPTVTGDALALLRPNVASQGALPSAGGSFGASPSTGTSDAMAAIFDLVAKLDSQERQPAGRNDVARYLSQSAEFADPNSDAIQDKARQLLTTVEEEDDPSLYKAVREGTVKLVYAGDLGLVYERQVKHFFTEDGRYTGGSATYDEQPGFNDQMTVTGDDGRMYDRQTGDRAGRMQVNGIPFYLTWPADLTG